MSRAAWLALGVGGGMACSPTRLLEVQVQGEISGDPGGPAEVWFLHAEVGEGELATPLGLIEKAWVDDPSDWSHTLLYPEEGGEGLVVYAWEDLDGDAVFCGLGAPEERAGLTEIADFPAFDVSVSIALTVACLGPEGMYP